MGYDNLLPYPYNYRAVPHIAHGDDCRCVSHRNISAGDPYDDATRGGVWLGKGLCDEARALYERNRALAHSFADANPNLLTGKRPAKHCLRQVIDTRHHCYRSRNSDVEECHHGGWGFHGGKWPGDHADVFALDNWTSGPRVIVSHEYDGKQAKDDPRWKEQPDDPQPHGKWGWYASGEGEIDTPWGTVAWRVGQPYASWYYPDTTKLIVVARPDVIDRINLEYPLLLAA